MSASAPSIEGTNSRFPLTAIGVVLVLVFLLGWPLILNDQFLLHVGTMLSLYAIGAMSLHLIIRTGHVSLGQAAFMGISAYTCALMVMKLNVPCLLSEDQEKVIEVI